MKKSTWFKWGYLLIATMIVVGILSLFRNRVHQSIVIGSKNFTESQVVSEIYAIALEKHGYQVTRKQNISNSVVYNALKTGQIDLYPEYTGTIVQAYLRKSTTGKLAKQIAQLAKNGVVKDGLTTLKYAPGNDSQGMAIRTSVAKKYHIYTLSELQKQASKVRLVSQGEFDQRSDALPGMNKLYGKYNFKSVKDYDDSLKYQVVDAGQGDAFPVSTTEGQLTETNKYTVLKDDKGLWPAYNLVPLIREQTLSQNPKIATILNQVDAKLTTKTLMQLNRQVDVDGQNYRTVANHWYQENFKEGD